MVVLSSTGKEALDKLLVEAREDPKLPGFIFGATTSESEIYFKGAGQRVFNDPSSGEINPETVFWICSQTKMITHLAALQLIERGHLHLDDPVSNYLPEFTNPIVLDDILADNPSFTSAKEVVRVKHLLNFTSGLFYPLQGSVPDKLPTPYIMPHSKEDHIGEFFKYLKGDLPGIPLQFEPGTDFAYGWSSDVLGFVIERAAKTTLDSYFKENIFNPLGIEASFYLTPELREKQITLRLDKEGVLQNADPDFTAFERDPEKVYCHFGGIGLYSSPKDYLTLLRHILQIYNGTAKHPVFSKEIISSIFTPALPEAGQKSISQLLLLNPSHPHEAMQWSTAFALNETDWPGKRKKGSGSWSGWANTYHFIDPATGIAAIFYSQILPPMHTEVQKYFAEFEKALYAGLN